ncbi:MAG: acetyl-CoA carboxylase carboxyltransferase subunit alpha [bacterium]|jgi:acetyl-CoA carboxylase carboxyl transferase subunit alpha
MSLDFEKDVADIEAKIEEFKAKNPEPTGSLVKDLNRLELERSEKLKETYANLTPWQTVQVARHPDRPLIRDFIAGLCSEFIELHGDRLFGDDHGMIGGFAMIENHRVMVIGHQKGRDLDEKIKCNFGQACPEGYRKALRLMKLAEKFHIPVVTFIDTPGAFPGRDAEERGQAEAIARNLLEMSALKTPVIALVTGEGGSGGAIGIGVGDVVLMLSNAVYSVISPEGCASILWRDGSKANEAANALKITAKSLLQLKIIDEIIPEPVGGAHRNYEGTMKATRKTLIKHLNSLEKIAPKKLTIRRFEKFAAMGRFK